MLAERHDIDRLPYSIKVLLENLLRHEDGPHVSADDIVAVAAWGVNPEGHGQGAGDSAHEIAFTPERVLMQDFTGVPAVVDLAAMRDALARLGGDATQVNPLVPVELVIDHSVIAERSGDAESYDANVSIEYERNLERYQLLRWAQGAFDDFRLVPPGTGICHQVNLEYLSRLVFATDDGRAFCDTLVGTDSHTAMVNGLGVLGWGVGGIEAEAAMLGQPLSMLLPPVVGLRISGETRARHHRDRRRPHRHRAAARPRRRRRLRRVLRPRRGGPAPRDPCHHRQHEPRVRGHLHDVPDRPGDARLPALHRPRRGAPRAGRGLRQGPGPLARPRRARAGLLRAPRARPGDVEPSLAGPARPQDRVALTRRARLVPRRARPRPRRRRPTEPAAAPHHQMTDGDVVIAAITSCTNTSNPQVLVAAGLLAKKAVERGLRAKPWVKTSLAPGSRVVMDYLERAGPDRAARAARLLPRRLRLHDLHRQLRSRCSTGSPRPCKEGDLSVAAVLSGNRNFEGRIHPDVRLNYLASPPLVVAYALAGTMDVDLTTEPIGEDADGNPVMLSDLWPSDGRGQRDHPRVAHLGHVPHPLRGRLRRRRVLASRCTVAEGETYAWQDDSTYVKNPPFFESMTMTPAPVTDIVDARVLVMVGDSVTTDHISPAGSIGPTTPAGQYLTDHGVEREDFNSYGARRGNHEVMMRGTFANVRLRNQLAPGTEGGVTLHLPDGGRPRSTRRRCSTPRTACRSSCWPGSEYGTGCSRDWAAKGTALLGVRAVIAQSLERIHRSNLIGMGVVPAAVLQGRLGREPRAHGSRALHHHRASTS